MVGWLRGRQGKSAAFALLVLLGGGVAVLAGISDRLSERTAAPGPAEETDATPAAAAVGAEPSALPSVRNAADSPTAEETALLEFISEPWTGDLDGMIERGFVRILTVYNPLFFSFDGARRRGLAVEMAENFETFLGGAFGRKGHPRLHVVLIPVPRDRLLPSLVEGRGDIVAANLTITPERRKRVDFSIPTYPDVAELAITGPAAPPLTSLEDLVEIGVFVRKSSSYYEHLTALNRARRLEGKPQIPIRAADENLEDYDLLEMVNAGLIPAVVVDSHKAALWAQVFEDIRVHEDISINSGGSIAWAVRKDSPQLLAAVNQFLKKNRKGTLVGNVLLSRYLEDADWIDNLLSGQAKDRHRDVIGIIKRYAGQYGFDWRIIAAQGYQESRLDQRKKSRAGAIGIMQVRPATAADPNVGIADIEDPEQNVHAGVKYLRFLRDRYFDAPEIDPLDRVLFSLAAYNAGPRSIARARQKASAMDLDPNTWFGHVEVAAARTISREPVRYVRNVYKYYIAYKNIEEMRAARDAAKRAFE